MSRPWAALVRSATCFPRVSGDEPVRQLVNYEGDVFSPRERG